MTSSWKPASSPIFATNPVVVPPTDLSLADFDSALYMAVNAILAMLATIPLRTGRRFDDPCHCFCLLNAKPVVMGVLTT
jgi:hypothetical protein